MPSLDEGVGNDNDSTLDVVNITLFCVKIQGGHSAHNIKFVLDTFSKKTKWLLVRNTQQVEVGYPTHVAVCRAKRDIPLVFIYTIEAEVGTNCRHVDCIPEVLAAPTIVSTGREPGDLIVHHVTTNR